MQEVSQFLHLLTGEQNPRVQWQTFRDPKDGVRIDGLAQTFFSNLDEATEFLTWAQSQLGGVYVCINATDGFGREESNITQLRVMFADYDGVDEPNWPLPPSFKTKRDDKHGHAFWVINPDEWDAIHWSMMQRRIALCCGTDTQVVDPARVVRVPWFKHLKNPSNPTSYRVVTGGSRVVYSKDQLLSAFKLSDDDEKRLQTWSENRQGLSTGQGYTDNPVYIARSIKWLSERATPAVEGLGGTETLIRSVAYLHDHGISLAKAKELAWDHYNGRCDPSWGDHERKHFDGVIERAYKYAKSEAGCKTAVGEFTRFTPVAEPVGGWDANAQINDVPHIEVTSHPKNNRINREEATRLQAQLTVKSSHYELARCADGAMFDGVRIVRYEKTFYVYNGKCWLVMSDDLIKSKIQHYYARYSPPNAFTKGVYDCMCDLVTVDDFQNKTWMNEEHTDARHTVAFNNCLVDFSGNEPMIYEHTPEFINFNVLPHNYNPNAKCPRFMQFLNQIWPNDKELHTQLVEWLGYQLIGGNHMQKMAVLVGKSRAGKGTIVKICTALVGEANATSTDLNDLAKDSTLQDMYRSSLTNLPDQHDVQFTNRSRVLSTLKAITGNDQMGWHAIYKGRQTGVISSKIMMTTNNIPTFSDASGALVKRMLVFPFNVSFEGNEDYDLEDKLIGEIEGITNLAIEGLVRLKNNKRFTEAQTAQVEKEEIQQEMFSLSGFIEECCVLNSADSVCTDTIYTAYKVWATTEGVKNPFDRRKFITELRNSPHDISRVKRWKDGGSKWCLSGINVSQAFKFDNVKSIQDASK